MGTYLLSCVSLWTNCFISRNFLERQVEFIWQRKQQSGRVSVAHYLIAINWWRSMNIEWQIPFEQLNLYLAFQSTKKGRQVLEITESNTAYEVAFLILRSLVI